MLCHFLIANLTSQAPLLSPILPPWMSVLSNEGLRFRPITSPLSRACLSHHVIQPPRSRSLSLCFAVQSVLKSKRLKLESLYSQICLVIIKCIAESVSRDARGGLNFISLRPRHDTAEFHLICCQCKCAGIGGPVAALFRYIILKINWKRNIYRFITQGCQIISRKSTDPENWT